MQILSPEQALQEGLALTPVAARKKQPRVVKDRRRVPSAAKAPSGRTAIQRLPTAPADKVAIDPDTGRYLRQYTVEDRTAVEAGIILAHAEGIRSATGTQDLHLDPLHADLDASTFADYMAAERRRQPGRILISPLSLSQPGLRRYVETMMRSALAPSTEFNLAPVSPHSLPLMVGGMTLGQMDKLCEEIFGAFGYVVKTEARLSDALCTVGYGPSVNHAYLTRPTDVDLESLNQATHETDVEQYLRRLSSTGVGQPLIDSISRLDWLKAQEGVELPQYLVQHGAFSCTHADRLAKLRSKVALRTAMTFAPTTSNFGRMTLEELKKNPVLLAQRRRISNATFANAVRRVYERSWFELDLISDINGMAQDVEVHMARELISALASTGPRATRDNVKIPATTLLGMALATGIPLGNIIRFAIEDLKRRGDTFISAETIKEIYDQGGLIDDLVMEERDGEVSSAYRCGEELEELYYDMLSLEEGSTSTARKRWNRKLRQGSSSLWSHRASNRYLLVKIVKQHDTNEDQEYYLVYPDRTLMGVRTQDLIE